MDEIKSVLKRFLNQLEPDEKKLLTPYLSVKTLDSLSKSFDDIVNSATRDVVTGHLLVEAVRNSNRIWESKREEGEISVSEKALEKIDVGREALEGLILKKAQELTPQYGIELVDVRIKRINYIEDVRLKVYERMIAERKRAAEQYRSEGRGKSAEIEGQLGKELKQITSEAYKKAEILKGEADAEVIKIYAEAYSRDPEFYSFMKTLQTYKDTIDEIRYRFKFILFYRQLYF